MARPRADDDFPVECARKYRPERILAAGGFGTVWLATQVDLGRPVAVKLLNADSLDPDEHVERFLTEARVTASLSHPNIVVLLDHGLDGGRPWIAYEYLPGSTLREELVDGPMPWWVALDVVSQVATAVEAAHEKGVLHRDLKPENIIHGGNGHYKVTDFGIAKWVSGSRVQTQAGYIMGTPAYVAPEQIARGLATPQTDIYSLGILLFELVVGTVPFNDENPVKILEKHVKADPPRPGALRPTVPGSVDRIVLKCLSKSPSRRYLTVGSFLKAVREALSTAPGQTSSPPRPAGSQPDRDGSNDPAPATVGRRPGADAGPRRIPGLVAAIAAVALALAMVYGLWPGARSAPPVASRTVAAGPGFARRLELAVEREQAVFATLTDTGFQLAVAPGGGVSQAQALLSRIQENHRELSTLWADLEPIRRDLGAHAGPALCVLERTAAYRFITWTEIQRVSDLLRYTRRKPRAGEELETMDVLGLASLASMKYGVEGIGLLGDHFEWAVATFDRAGGTGQGDVVARVLADNFLVGSCFNVGDPEPRHLASYCGLVHGFKRKLSALAPPVGPPLVDAIGDFWEWRFAACCRQSPCPTSSQVHADLIRLEEAVGGPKAAFDDLRRWIVRKEKSRGAGPAPDAPASAR
ncbi:MAG: serine/threonine protein kinase [Candidatus Riflebacteria bacterium]|nr:serine/threonine protein kinase [Candidatus Riflebacteria bacterium]